MDIGQTLPEMFFFCMHHSMVKVCIYLFNRTLDIELTEILENVPLSTVQKSDASGVEENDFEA
jgi:hypothetical protein